MTNSCIDASSHIESDPTSRRIRIVPAPRYEPCGSTLTDISHESPTEFTDRSRADECCAHATRTSAAGTTPAVPSPAAPSPGTASPAVLLPGTASPAGASPGAARTQSRAAAAIAAREFSVGTLTMIFEVIARRRPSGHLLHRVGSQVNDQIGALARTRAAGGDDTCIPTVRRVHVQMCDAGTAEIFGTYSRQGRSRAFAGRIERVPCRVRVVGQAPRGRYTPAATRVEYRWQLVVLTLG